MFEGYTSELLQRPERFVVSGPILIATAIGAASVATAGVTAHYIAKEETNRIVEEVKIHRRRMWTMGYTTTCSILISLRPSPKTWII